MLRKSKNNFRQTLKKALLLNILFLFIFLFSNSIAPKALAATSYSDCSLDATPNLGIDPNIDTGYLPSTWVKIKKNSSSVITLTFGQGAGIPNTACSKYQAMLGIDSQWKDANCQDSFKGNIGEISYSFYSAKDGNFPVKFYLRQRNFGEDFTGSCGTVGVYEESGGVNFSSSPVVTASTKCDAVSQAITRVTSTTGKKIGAVAIPSGALELWSSNACPARSDLAVYYGALEIGKEWYGCSQFQNREGNKCLISGTKSISDLNGLSYFDIILIGPRKTCCVNTECTAYGRFVSDSGWKLYLKGTSVYNSPANPPSAGTCSLSGSTGYFAADYDHNVPPNLPTHKISVLKNKSFYLATTLDSPVPGTCQDYDLYIGAGNSWQKANCDGYGTNVWGANLNQSLSQLTDYQIGLAVVRKSDGKKLWENLNCGTVKVYEVDSKAPLTDSRVIGATNLVGFGQTFSKWITANPVKEIGGLKIKLAFERKTPFCTSGQLTVYKNGQPYACGYVDISGNKFFRDGVWGVMEKEVGIIQGLIKVYYNLVPPNVPGCTAATCWVKTLIANPTDIVLYDRPLSFVPLSPPSFR